MANGDRKPFLDGGNHPMQPPTGTGQQTPGKSSQEGSGSISSSPEPQAGPPGAGFYSTGTSNKDYAGTKQAGSTAQTKSGGNAKFAEGGSTPMFGNRGSLPARGGYTTPG